MEKYRSIPMTGKAIIWVDVESVWAKVCASQSAVSDHGCKKCLKEMKNSFYI